MSTITTLVRFSAAMASILLAASAAKAASPGKEECLDSFGKGQDAREAGQLSQAGKLFLSCAQHSCPALVQSECARLADEIAKLQPSVTFVARDGAQNDLPDTLVFVDGAQVATRLGDGKAHEVDPGRHEVRFVHAGKEVTITVVVNQGEKGRGVVGLFPAPAGASLVIAPPFEMTPIVKEPASRVPASCSLSTNECVAPPKDPAFAQASSGVSMANLGAIVGGAGGATFLGSLIWYLAQTPHADAPALSTGSRSLVPWVGPQGAGLSLSGAL